MSWLGLEGHDEHVEHFRLALERGRFSSAWLFVGPPGIGKRSFADRLAQTLLCRQRPAKLMNPCGECDSCVQAQALTHPDLLVVGKPADKNEIPVALIIGEQERRMQEGFLHDLSLRPSMGHRRVGIIDDADALNEAGANALLKTLEEPAPGAVIILIGTSPQRQLPTIRSRTQLVRFDPLPNDVVARLLIERRETPDPASAMRLAELSGGSVQRAIELADEELWSFREKLFAALRGPSINSVALGRLVATFVEDVGKEAVDRRRRTRQVFEMAADFQRALSRRLCGAEVLGSQDLQIAVEQAAQSATDADPELSADRALRTLEAVEQVDRYINLTTLIECWADDLVHRPAAARLPSPT